MRIIIVDDIFTNRLLLSEIIEELGYEFYVAKNGREAVDELAKNQYDLVLMDIEMPVMNGVEALHNIRESDSISDEMKKVPMGNKGLSKLPSKVRNKMGYMNKGGVVPKGMHRMPDGTMMKDSDHKGMAYGGMVNKKKMGYAHGGSVKEANCGASMKPNRKART